MPPPRPFLYVLAGVNGAGKSSIGGQLLRQAGLDWFDPDAFARALVEATGCDQVAANAAAWQEGLRRLDEALASGRNHAFETTLGGNTIPERIATASRTHDVLVWFCGLDSPGRHIARVQAREDAGGHAIPESKVRERYPRALANLIGLLPYLSQLQVYDNSVEARDGVIPDPVLVLEIDQGVLRWPRTAADLRRTPDWAKPVVEAVLGSDDGPASIEPA